MIVQSKNKLAASLWTIVPAAGVGSRFDPLLPKQYALMTNRKTVLDQTLSVLLQHPRIKNILLALDPEDAHWCDSSFYHCTSITTTAGGHDRAHSVLNGLLSLTDVASEKDWVLVHDACRPYVAHNDIDHLLSLVTDDHPVGGLLAIPLTDTVKYVENNQVIKTVSRDLLWRAQTPQLFRYGLLKKALVTALEKKHAITDESSAIEWLGLAPLIIQGSAKNIKITYLEDLESRQ